MGQSHPLKVFYIYDYTDAISVAACLLFKLELVSVFTLYTALKCFTCRNTDNTMQGLQSL